MIKYLATLFALLFLGCFTILDLYAQAPGAMTYQAEVRNSKGDIIKNTDFDVTIGILESSIGTTPALTYYYTVTTDKYGLFTVTIGDPTDPNDPLYSLAWELYPHFLKVQVTDDKNNTFDLGTTQLLSVPYALHAKTAETTVYDNVNDADADPTNELQDISLSGTSLSLSMGSTIDLGELPDAVNDADADPLNEIQDLHLDGNILTITMNNSATEIDLGAYLDNTDTHLTEAEVDAMVDNNGYLTGVTWADIPDVPADIADGDNDTQLTEAEVDAMVDNNGYLTEASDDQTLLLSGHELGIEDGNSVTLPDEVNDADPDPTNELISGFILNGNSVELSDAGGTRTIDLGSLEGDFSDGGDAADTDRTLGNTSDHSLSLLTNNANRLHIKNTGEIGIGTTIPSQMLEVAGTIYSTTGGFKFPDGTVQVTASTSSGGASRIDDLTDGKTSFYSVYLGTYAGANDDRSVNRFSTAIGYDALSDITTGRWNEAMGWGVLTSNTTGSYNVGMGSQALESNTTGNGNVSIGREANQYNGGGSHNTIVGDQAGRGQSLHNKSGNVFLGYQAGYYETGSNLLYIENSTSPLPLIWGDFSQDKIKINGSMEVTSSFKAWQIQLGSGAHNGYVLTSDASGNGSWQSLASSPWTVTGYDMYRLLGNVGIGTNDPIFKLDVNGNVRFDGSVRADKLIIPATEQYYSIAGCTFNPTTSYSDARSINCIYIQSNVAYGDADLVAPVHIPSGATLENISALVYDNGPATITVSLYLVAYNGGKFNLGSTNSSINSSSPQNLSGSLSSTVDNNNNALIAVVRCYGTPSSDYYRIYKVKIRYSISALP